MAYNDDLPTWGATGSKPSDGTSRSPGDNIDASEYNYLWYILNETFGEIDTDVSNIETGGVADDPHGNDAHSPNFLAQTDYDPAGDIDFSQLLLNNPHDNSAHSETYLTDTYDPSTDLNFPTILEQAGNQHDNAAHSENYLPTSAYTPGDDISLPSILEQTGNQHDNAAHSQNFLPRDEAFAPNTRSEIHRVTDVTLSGNGGTDLHILSFDTPFPSTPSVQVTLNGRNTGDLPASNEVRATPVTTDANDGVAVQVFNGSSESVTFDIEVLAYGPRSSSNSFTGTTHTATETQQ